MHFIAAVRPGRAGGAGAGLDPAVIVAVIDPHHGRGVEAVAVALAGLQAERGVGPKLDLPRQQGVGQEGPFFIAAVAIDKMQAARVGRDQHPVGKLDAAVRLHDPVIGRDHGPGMQHVREQEAGVVRFFGAIRIPVAILIIDIPAQRPLHEFHAFRVLPERLDGLIVRLDPGRIRIGRGKRRRRQHRRRRRGHGIRLAHGVPRGLERGVFPVAVVQQKAGTRQGSTRAGGFRGRAAAFDVGINRAPGVVGDPAPGAALGDLGAGFAGFMP